MTDNKWTRESAANIQLIKLIRSDVIPKTMSAKDIQVRAKLGEADFKVFEAYRLPVIKAHLKSCRSYVRSNPNKGKLEGKQ